MEDETMVDAVRLMRQLRDRVTRELDGLTFEETRRWIQDQIAQPNVPPVPPTDKRE
jgi:hypothetical protein